MHLNYKWKLILRVKKKKQKTRRPDQRLTNSTNPIPMQESRVNCSPKIETK